MKLLPDWLKNGYLAVIDPVANWLVRRGVHPAEVAFLALDPKGRVGAACTEKTNFTYAVAQPGKVELLKAPELGPEK